MKIKSKNIRYVYDQNYYKQNKFIPNTGIRIKDPREIKKDRPDYIIIFPWNINDEIKKKLIFTKKWGCKL